MTSLESRHMKLVKCYILIVSTFIMVQILASLSLENEIQTIDRNKQTNEIKTKTINKLKMRLRNNTINSGINNSNTTSYLKVYSDLYFDDKVDKDNPISATSFDVDSESPSISIPLVIVVCDGKGSSTDGIFGTLSAWERQEIQIRTMLGSLLLFSKSQTWRIIAVTDSWKTYFSILSLTFAWPEKHKKRLQFERYHGDFEIPAHPLMGEWRPCSWTKIFLPDILTHLDFVVYMDTDFVFLGPAEDLWSEIPNMKDAQIIVGLGPEAWYEYERDNRAMAGNRGLNTGILLMNLTRARNVSNESFGQQIMKEIPAAVNPRHDQDVVNSYLSKHPELLFEMSSRYNFLPSVCILNLTCQECKDRGIVAFHGADGSFFSIVDSRWRVIYAILNDVTKLLTITFPRLLALFKSQLEQFQRSGIGGACSNYKLFNNMVLHNLRRL